MGNEESASLDFSTVCLFFFHCLKLKSVCCSVCSLYTTGFFLYVHCQPRVQSLTTRHVASSQPVRASLRCVSASGPQSLLLLQEEGAKKPNPVLKLEFVPRLTPDIKAYFSFVGWSCTQLCLDEFVVSYLHEKNHPLSLILILSWLSSRLQAAEITQTE